MCNWCIARDSIKTVMKRCGLRSRELTLEIDDWDCEDETDKEEEDDKEEDDENEEETNTNEESSKTKVSS